MLFRSRRIDAFELWCWRRLLRVPWTSRRSNQSILKEISPGCSLEGTLPGQPSSTAALALPYPVGNLGWDWFSTLSRWPQTEPECSSKQLLPQRGLAQPTKAPPPEVCGWTWPPDMQSSGLASESALLGVSSPHLPTHLQQTQPGLGDATHRDRLGSGMLCCGDCT